MSQQITHGGATAAGVGGFQRQMVIGGPQVSGLSMGMQSLGPNQPPPPPTTTTTHQNGYPTPQQQSYFPPTSPTINNDGPHFQVSLHNAPPSPPKYRSGLSSALQNQGIIDPELPRSSSSFNLLGPLDANFPSSVDLTNNQYSRHGPFAASVPTKFGLLNSGISSMTGSIRERVVPGDYPGSGTQSPSHGGEFSSRYGSPIDSMPWNQDSFRTGNPLQGIQAARNHPPTSPLHSRPQSSSSPFTPFEPKQPQQAPPSSRLNAFNRSRLPPISSSVPAHFGENGLFSPIPAEDEEALDTDALPSSLHDEVLLPQERNRRSSQSHTPGLNRRSAAYDEYARSPPSGAVTPGSERGGAGGSLSGSPGSSRMEPMWAKVASDDRNDVPEFSSSNLNSGSRQRVTSPLRNTLDPSTSTYFRSPTTSTPTTSSRAPSIDQQQSGHLPLKTPSVHAAQKWGGRTAEKLFPHQPQQMINGEEVHAVNVPGVVWRLTGEIIGTGRGELTKEEVRRIEEEEEGDPFSMDS